MTQASDPLQDDTTALAELVSSRLCHDLINPVGAIGNGVELLQSLVPGSPELDLIAESTGMATAKVRFFRIAFGAARSSETIEAAVIDDILAGVYASGRLRINWTPRALHRPEARLLFLAILCAESALPAGGTLGIDIAPPRLSIQAMGRRTRFETPPWSHLLDGTQIEGCSSAQVHFLLVRRFLSVEGRSAKLTEREDGFELDFQPG
ncbi:MAG: histidine phosphotransferase family protein [Pseudomonadota bacterium]